MVRDIFAGDEAQRQLSRIQMLFAAAPIIAPILGGWMVAHLAWPSIFWFLGAFAVMLTVWSVLSLPESHAAANRLPLEIKPLARTYWRSMRFGQAQHRPHGQHHGERTEKPEDRRPR